MGRSETRTLPRYAAQLTALAADGRVLPLLVLTGEKASGTVLIDQTKLVANNVKGIIVKGSGHWLMEEAPGQVIPEVVSFINDVPDTASIQRLTPDDINALKATGPGVGTSGVSRGEDGDLIR